MTMSAEKNYVSKKALVLKINFTFSFKHEKTFIF